MTDDTRLARIERKLDEVGKALVALARMEERSLTLFNRMEALEARQEKHNDRLADMENKVGTNGQSLRFAERVFWIVVTAGVAYIINAARNGQA